MPKYLRYSAIISAIIISETLVCAFITSKIDYCNGLLFGLPESQTMKLQLMIMCLRQLQNVACRQLPPPLQLMIMCLRQLQNVPWRQLLPLLFSNLHVMVSHKLACNKISEIFCYYISYYTDDLCSLCREKWFYPFPSLPARLTSDIAQSCYTWKLGK